jgi:hypothetical protein
MPRFRALDPQVVATLIAAPKRRSALDELTPREREVLSLMAEGRTNALAPAAFRAKRKPETIRAFSKPVSFTYASVDGTRASRSPATSSRSTRSTSWATTSATPSARR